MSEWVSEWVSACVSEWSSKWLSEWTNLLLSDRMSDRKRERERERERERKMLFLLCVCACRVPLPSIIIALLELAILASMLQLLGINLFYYIVRTICKSYICRWISATSSSLISPLMHHFYMKSRKSVLWIYTWFFLHSSSAISHKE